MIKVRGKSDGKSNKLPRLKEVRDGKRLLLIRDFSDFIHYYTCFLSVKYVQRQH